MKTSAKGIVAIALHEGIVPAPYLDSVGVWTYGIGHTKGAGDPDPAKMVKDMPGADTLDREVDRAIDLFAIDLEDYERRVNDAVKVPMAQHEFDALVSFDFNTGGIYKAKLTKALNAGDRAKAADGFMGWLRPIEIKARRTSEMNLFEHGKYPTGDVPIWRTDGAGRLRGIVRRMPAEKLLSMVGAAPAPSPLAAIIQTILRLFRSKS